MLTFGREIKMFGCSEVYSHKVCHKDFISVVLWSWANRIHGSRSFGFCANFTLAIIASGLFFVIRVPLWKVGINWWTKLVFQRRILHFNASGTTIFKERRCKQNLIWVLARSDDLHWGGGSVPNNSELSQIFQYKLTFCKKTTKKASLHSPFFTFLILENLSIF